MISNLGEVTSSKVLAVIVLYKTRLSDAPVLASLLESLRQTPEAIQMTIFVHDNTPVEQTIGMVPQGVLYEASPANVGLSGAYNRALEIARGFGAEWLLTLDQDTCLPLSFVSRLARLISDVSRDESIAAIAPRVIGDGRILSPNWFAAGAITRYFPEGYSGVPAKFVSAFNSSSALRVEALCHVGGYSPEFPLDYCDAYIYKRLYEVGYRVYVAGDIQIEHNFSMLDIKNRMSLERYQNVLSAGCAFWDIYMGRLAAVEHTLRLLARLLYKHPRNRDDYQFRRATFEALKKRLLHSRKRRILDWKRNVSDHSF